MDATDNVKKTITVHLPVRQGLFLEEYKKTNGLSKSETIRRLIDTLIDKLVKEEEEGMRDKVIKGNQYVYRQFK